jgi:hypothetical protein
MATAGFSAALEGFSAALEMMGERWDRKEDKSVQGQQQIPCGNDNKKATAEAEGRRRFQPCGC